MFLLGSERVEAGDWYDGALVDLEEARTALASGRNNWAAFAAHQAVEKALKSAYIVLKRRLPPETNDLTRLLSELELPLPESLRVGVSELTPYYTVSRYPNAGLERPWEGIERSTAEKFVELAEEVVKKVGEVLGFGEVGGTRSR